MERLTESENKYYGDQQHIRQMCYMGFDGTCEYPTCNGCQILKMYRELAAYQDTGLTPAEITDGKLLTGWIPVSKILPKERGYYLAVVKRVAPEDLGGNAFMVKIMRWMGHDWRYAYHVPGWINEKITDTVTYWIPLPQPPKED